MVVLMVVVVVVVLMELVEGDEEERVKLDITRMLPLPSTTMLHTQMYTHMHKHTDSHLQDLGYYEPGTGVRAKGVDDDADREVSEMCG